MYYLFNSERSSILCCPRDLRPGDIYTHTFIGHKSTIIDASTRSVYPDVIDAKQRGVLFDVGHGQKAFSWPVAEICAKSGFWPDIIGSDLHTGNHEGPVYDLPTVMSKFLHIGMPITEIVKATTLTPARAIKLQNSIGSLTTGKLADITVLKIIDVDHDLEDGRCQNRRIKKVIIPIAVWKGGEQFQITKPRDFPNPEVLARNAPTMNNDIIRDVISL